MRGVRVAVGAAPVEERVLDLLTQHEGALPEGLYLVLMNLCRDHHRLRARLAETLTRLDRAVARAALLQHKRALLQHKRRAAPAGRRKRVRDV